MQSFYRSLISVRHTLSSSRIVNLQSTQGYLTNAGRGLGAGEFNSLYGLNAGSSIGNAKSYSFCSIHRRPGLSLFQQGSLVPNSPSRLITTLGNSDASSSPESDSVPDVAPRIKFKRLDKTAHHIMQILDKEAVEEVRSEREIPDIKPGYIIQLKVVVPENRRRSSVIKGIVIARRNAGLNSTFRLRRLVAGVGVESLFPLYSPNIKEIKVLDKKKVRRAKLYYLRDKMNALKKH